VFDGIVFRLFSSTNKMQYYSSLVLDNNSKSLISSVLLIVNLL